MAINQKIKPLPIVLSNNQKYKAANEPAIIEPKNRSNIDAPINKAKITLAAV